MFLYSTVSTLKPGGREEGRQRRAGDDVGGVIGTHTDGGDSRDNLAELELVEDGGLTSGIETDLVAIPITDYRPEYGLILTINIPKARRSTCQKSE